MDSKTLFYHANGDGRDSYITVNNGGMFAATQPLPEYPVASFPSRPLVRPSPRGSPQRTVRYRSNGTGRDMYISTNAGGFEGRTFRYCPGAVFYKSLRDEPMLRSYDTRDYMQMQRNWLPVRSISTLRIQGKRQEALLRRLYQPHTKAPSRR